MASSTQTFQTLGDRWAAALRAVYVGPSVAKTVAREFAVEIRTAEGWLAGRPPRAKDLATAALLHGGAFALMVLLPKPAGTENQIRKIKRDGAALADRLRRIEPVCMEEEAR